MPRPSHSSRFYHANNMWWMFSKRTRWHAVWSQPVRQLSVSQAVVSVWQDILNLPPVSSVLL
jgi:hypothetical protein